MNKLPDFCARCGNKFPDRTSTADELKELGIEGDPNDYGAVLIQESPEGTICIDCIEKEDPKSAMGLRAFDWNHMVMASINCSPHK